MRNWSFDFIFVPHIGGRFRTNRYAASSRPVEGPRELTPSRRLGQEQHLSGDHGFGWTGWRKGRCEPPLHALCGAARRKRAVPLLRGRAALRSRPRPVSIRLLRGGIPWLLHGGRRHEACAASPVPRLPAAVVSGGVLRVVRGFCGS